MCYCRAPRYLARAPKGPKSLGRGPKGGPEGPQNIEMGQPIILEIRFFPFVTMEKIIFYSPWAPMGPPVAVGPG